MKKANILLFLLISASTFSQTAIFPFFENGKWGVVNKNSEIIIPAKYNNISIEYEQIIAQEKNKYGILEKNGKNFLEFNYDSIQFASNQYALLYYDNYIEILNVNTKKILEKVTRNKIKRYDITNLLVQFSDNLLFLDLTNNQEHWLNADTLLYKLEKNTAYKSSMADYLTTAKDYIKIGKKGKQGIITSDFQEIIAPEYTFIKKEDNFFVVGKNENYGIINFDGKEMLPCIYTEIKIQNPYISVKKDGKYGYFTADLKKVLNVEYDYIYATAYDIIVTNKNGYVGACNSDGSTIFEPNKYTTLEPMNSKFFLFSTGSDLGVISRSRQVIINEEYDDIYSLEGLGFATKKKSKFGFINITGTYKVSPQFDHVSKLNSSYVLVQNKAKYGVINSKGEGIIPINYRAISATVHNNIFKVHGFRNQKISGSEIQQIINADIPMGYSDIQYIEYKWGVLNSKGQILLDTIYYQQQIEYDFDNFAIKVAQDSSMLVVKFDENGEFIDKITYKNYIKFNIQSLKTGDRWQVNPRKENKLWGYVSAAGKNIIPYQFDEIQQNYRNDSALVLTKNPYRTPLIETKITVGNEDIIVKTSPNNGRFGVVNQKTQQEIMPCRFVSILLSDFNNAQVARCLATNTDFYLANEKMEILNKKYAYIDDFQDSLARFNAGGMLTISNTKTYFLNTPLYKSEGLDALKTEKYNLECRSGKWGIMNRKGEILIPGKYDFLQKYYKNEFIAKKENKWGVIYTNDSVKIKFKFDEMHYFYDLSQENKWSTLDFYKIRIGEFWGVADGNGEIIISPKFEDIKLLNSSNSTFFAVCKNKLWGVISENEQEIVPIKFSDVSYLSKENKDYFKTRNTGKFTGFVDENGNLLNKTFYLDARNFVNNYAAVYLGNGNWNFVNKDMNLISQKNFLAVGDFNNQRAAVSLSKGWNFINENGELLSNDLFYKVANFSENLAIVQVKYPAKLLGIIPEKIKTGVINDKGEFVLNPKYSTIYDYKNSVAVFDKKGKLGLLSKTGTILLPPKYTRMSKFSVEGLTVVENSKKEFAVIDSLGKFIVPFGKYESISEFNEGMALVKSKKLIGYIDSKGIEVFKPQFKEAENFSEGFAAVKSNKLWGYINKEKLIFPENFKKAENFSNGYAKVIDANNKRFYIDNNGNSNLTEPLFLVEGFSKRTNSQQKTIFIDQSGNNPFLYSFDKASDFKNELAIVAYKKKYGIINSKGYYIVLPNLLYINNFSENKAVCKFDNVYGLYDTKGKEMLETLNLSVEGIGLNKIKVTQFNKIYYIDLE